VSRFSARTLRAFEDACASSLWLRHIDDVFKDAGILKGDIEGGSSGRRGVFRAYVASADQNDIRAVVRLADALGAIVERLDDDGDHEKAAALRAHALKDGFTYSNAHFEAASSSATIFAAVEIDDLGELPAVVQRLHLLCVDSPSEAIGGAKELIETVCRTILRLAGEAQPVASADLGELTKATMKVLELAPADVDSAKKGVDLIRLCLQQLGAVVNSLGQLRNLYGSGHGRDGAWRGLGSRHARLAVGAASTAAAFIAETFQERGGGAHRKPPPNGRGTRES